MDWLPLQMMRSEQLLAVAKQVGYETAEELAAAVGFGHVPTSQVMSKLHRPCREKFQTVAPEGLQCRTSR